MFKALFHAVALSVAFVASLFGSHAYTVTPQASPPVLGATIPVVVTRFQTSLQASITSAATSMTLVAGTDAAGNALSGYTCFTLDEGTSVAEDVCGSASGTAVTSLVRGISPTTGNTSVASLEFTHRRGASVKITDAPQLPILSRILNGNETLPNPLVYDSSVSTTTIGSTLQNVASVAYVNGVAVSGAPNASISAKGLVQAATTAQVIAGTGSGSTGALLFAQTSLYNATSSATTLIPVTRSSGKLSQGFLDLTETFTFTATTTLASTTINGNLTVNSATSTFAIPPILTASTTQTTQAATKQYVDNRFSFAAATTTGVSSWNSASNTTTITSILFTPPIAGKALIQGIVSASNGTTGGQGCIVRLYIDNVNQGDMARFTNLINGTSAMENTMNFSFATSQLTAAQHTIAMSGLTITGGTCIVTSGGPFLSALNIGN